MIYKVFSEPIEYPNGLGGANLSILCQPKAIMKGDVVNIQVLYSVDILRPIDLHFDILQEPDKKWLAGSQIPLYENNGSLSINLTLPINFNENAIIWKVFLTPSGDRFPNMLTEVGLNIPFTNETQGQCPYLAIESNAVFHNNIDFILIQSFSKNVTPFVFEMIYSLQSQDRGEISIQIMDELTNEWIFGIPVLYVERTPYQNKSISLIIPHLFKHVQHHPHVYLDVSLNPLGSDWFHRLAEDRTYQLFTQDEKTFP